MHLLSVYDITFEICQYLNARELGALMCVDTELHRTVRGLTHTDSVTQFEILPHTVVEIRCKIMPLMHRVIHKEVIGVKVSHSGSNVGLSPKRILTTYNGTIAATYSGGYLFTYARDGLVQHSLILSDEFIGAFATAPITFQSCVDLFIQYMITRRISSGMLECPPLLTTLEYIISNPGGQGGIYDRIDATLRYFNCTHI